MCGWAFWTDVTPGRLSRELQLDSDWLQPAAIRPDAGSKRAESGAKKADTYVDPWESRRTVRR